MWPRGELAELLGIEHPILQAPMAGSTTPALAAAVSSAGGLGALGCGTRPLPDLKVDVEALCAATNRPFNLNFFAYPAPKRDRQAEAETAARLKPFYDELGLGEVLAPGEPASGPFDADRLSRSTGSFPQPSSSARWSRRRKRFSARGAHRAGHDLD